MEMKIVLDNHVWLLNDEIIEETISNNSSEYNIIIIKISDNLTSELLEIPYCGFISQQIN